MNADDPKFTAYALDELDPAERAEIEAELRAQPALAHEIEEMRRFTAQLRGELHAEVGARLSAEQRAAVLGAARVVAGPRAWWRKQWVQSAAAACVIVGVSAAILAKVEMKTPQFTSEAPRGVSVGVTQEMELNREPGNEPVIEGSKVIAEAKPAIPPPTIKSEFREDRALSLAVPADPAEPAGLDSGQLAASQPGSIRILAKETAVLPVTKLSSATPSSGLAAGRGRLTGGLMWNQKLAKAATGGADLTDGLKDSPRAEVGRGFDSLDAAGNTEAYDAIADNAFLAVKDQPLSTFSVDVDTASYANVRRLLNANERPPKGAVRIEELVNYFHYDYPQPDGADPFSCALEVATCPWQTEHRLVRIGLKGREIKREARPVANLVFLVDVSGSMQPENKLPLVKQSLRMLVDQLNPDDTVAIAVYAGASGCVLEPTHDKNKIRDALARLESGGSTNGAAGIQLAYDLVQRSFKKGGTNRVILCTDGDFNVGITSQSELVSMIQGKAKTGIFLSVLGFGMGNLKDSTLEKLADKGNGNYAYIDTIAEGRKVFVEQIAGTLFTIAKDVKVQIEFNPAKVGAYRLIGYENRLLAKEDFNDDTKDAGEIGAGHTVTALYEIVPAGKDVPGTPVVDDLKYQKAAKADAPVADGEEGSKEMLTVKVRYKQPEGDASKKLEFPLVDSGATWEKSSRDFRWAASVASFGLLLRDSPHKGAANWGMTLELASEGRGEDREGYRAEFVGLVEKAQALSR